MKFTSILIMAAFAAFGLMGVLYAQNIESDVLKRNQLIQCINTQYLYHNEAHAIIASSIDDVKNYKHLNTRLKILSDDYHMVLMSFENKNAFGNMTQNILLARANNDNCEIAEMDISKKVNFNPPDEFYEGFFDVAKLTAQE